MNVIKALCAVLAVIFAGISVYVRLAPVDPAVWNVDLATRVDLDFQASQDKVFKTDNGAYAFSHMSLEDLQTRAARTPRTALIAGTIAEGRITWESRSLVWGFPDYTTAQVSGNGLLIYARSRFGPQDYGVNAKRLAAWLTGN